MKKTLILFCCFIFTITTALAQGPKWVTKAKKAVFSVITFNHDNQILNKGNGFFIGDDGIAVSDYKLFKNAYKAIVIDSDGKEMHVHSILGADDTYDIVKFRVDTKGKKVAALELNSEAVSNGDEVLVLPYSVEKDRACRPGVVRTVEDIRGGYKYFTIDMRLTDMLISCPVMTNSGKVIGLMEQSYGSSKSDIMCHAVDANFASSLNITALSFDNSALNGIKIKKGLPLEEDQALAYLLILRESISSKEYFELLLDFKKQFPNSAESYFNIAKYYLEQENVSEQTLKLAYNEIQGALKLKDINISEAYYSASKLIAQGHFLPVAKGQKDWSLSEATFLIDKAIAENPLPIYFQIKGDILASALEWDKALEAYSVVNKSDLRSPQSLLVTARILEQSGKQTEVVLATLDSCVNMLSEPYDINSAIYLFERGRVNADAGKYRASMIDLNNYYYAVNGQVNDQFYYFREQIAVKARMYQQALDDITAAINLNPEELLYYSEKAALNLKVGRYDETLIILDDLLNKDASYAEAYRLQGIAYSQLKDKRACSSLKKAEELGDPFATDLIKKMCN